MKERKISDQKYERKTKDTKQDFYRKVGTNCFICKSEVSCHRKDFKPHKRLANLTLQQINKEKVDDYVRVCYACHYGIHPIISLSYLGKK